MSRLKLCGLGLTAVLLVLVASSAATAQECAAGGHWKGAIEIPGAALEVHIELAEAGKGWTGTISIPVQNAVDLPLTAITCDGADVGFAIDGVPGEPTFRGRVEGETVSGDFTQGGQTFPFTLDRAAAPATEAEAALAGIDAVITKALDDFGVPGLGLGVVVDGEVVLARGFGLRDVEANLPVTADTLFAIGSATKAFTTMVLGQLVDQGVIAWDEPVLSYLPDFRLSDDHATRRITVRDLVCHRSGLPRHDLTWYNAAATRRDLYARLRHLEPFRDLRERYHYQNLMFLVAGYLVEQVTGSSWEDNVRERVFAPLGMTSSNFSVEVSQQQADFAQPYNYDDGDTTRVDFRSIDAMGPAGSINSSINDMVRWLQLHLGGGRFGEAQLVQPATLREMHSPQTIVSSYPQADDDVLMMVYGLGWFIEAYRGHYRVQHGGGIDGFITMVSFLPRKRIGVVTLSNASGVALSPLLNRLVVDRLLGEADSDLLGEALSRRALAEEAASQAEAAMDEVRIAGTSPSHGLDEYAGSYLNPGYGAIEVVVENGDLVLTFNRMTHQLQHWHYDVFMAPDDGAIGLGGTRFQFRIDMDGHVAELVAPFEPEAGSIVFDRQPDECLRDPDFLERFTGSYALREDAGVTVTLRGSTLVVEVEGQPPYRLAPVRGTTFDLEGLDGFSVTFVEEEDRTCSAVRFNQPNGVFTAKRAEE